MEKVRLCSLRPYISLEGAHHLMRLVNLAMVRNRTAGVYINGDSL